MWYIVGGLFLVLLVATPFVVKMIDNWLTASINGVLNKL